MLLGMAVAVAERRGPDLHPWVSSSLDLRSPKARKHMESLMPPCVAQNAKSQHWEDRMVFLPLRCMRGGMPGTFVELGAYTGIELSNTYMLERCFDYNGVLIEGSPSNYAQLVQSGRRAKMVHSAVCPGSKDGFVNFTATGGDFSGEPALRNAHTQKRRNARTSRQIARLDAGSVTLVPCKSLKRLLDEAGYGQIDVLFLDVEGAEGKVLSSVDVARFAMVVMEAVDGERHRREVEPLLLRAGFRRERRLEAHAYGEYNPVYVRTHGGQAPIMTARCINCAAIPSCRARFERPWNATTAQEESTLPLAVRAGARLPLPAHARHAGNYEGLDDHRAESRVPQPSQPAPVPRAAPRAEAAPPAVDTAGAPPLRRSPATLTVSPQHPFYSVLASRLMTLACVAVLAIAVCYVCHTRDRGAV